VHGFSVFPLGLGCSTAISNVIAQLDQNLAASTRLILLQRMNHIKQALCRLVKGKKRGWLPSPELLYNASCWTAAQNREVRRMAESWELGLRAKGHHASSLLLRLTYEDMQLEPNRTTHALLEWLGVPEGERAVDEPSSNQHKRGSENATEQSPEYSASVHEFFEARARDHPDGPCLLTHLRSEARIDPALHPCGSGAGCPRPSLLA